MACDFGKIADYQSASCFSRLFSGLSASVGFRLMEEKIGFNESLKFTTERVIVGGAPEGFVERSCNRLSVSLPFVVEQLRNRELDYNAVIGMILQ